MPMTFTDDVVLQYLEMSKLDTSGDSDEKRERLASYNESKYSDYVAAWEIRTGRPWIEMTKQEAIDLVAKHPQLMRNPGILSKLHGTP